MSPLLAIETATANRLHPASIALRHHGQTEILVLEEPNSQAAKLVSSIEGLLEKHGLWYEDLGQLAITVGPGSFTGIRIGLSVARSIAFSCRGLQLIAVSTPEALMGGYTGGKTEVLSTMKAGKGELYAQPFVKRDGLWHATGDISLCTPDALPQSTYYGNGMSGHTTEIGALDVLAALERTQIEPRDCVPLYIRTPDAKLPQKVAL
jgi:tRNA threonylcarbamoyladenosine biosynthesis protein TsaB